MFSFIGPVASVSVAGCSIYLRPLTNGTSDQAPSQRCGVIAPVVTGSGEVEAAGYHQEMSRVYSEGRNLCTHTKLH